MSHMLRVHVSTNVYYYPGPVQHSVRVYIAVCSESEFRRHVNCISTRDFSSKLTSRSDAVEAFTKRLYLYCRT